MSHAAAQATGQEQATGQGTAGLDSQLPAIGTWGNQFRGYEVLLEDTAFTSVCPTSGSPDLGTLTVRYMPHESCLEAKSLKEYLGAYREIKIFPENVVHRVLEDVVKAAAPVWCEVTVECRKQDGLRIVVTARHPLMESGQPAAGTPDLQEEVAVAINAAAFHMQKELAKAASRDVTDEAGRQKVIVHHRFHAAIEQVYDAFLHAKSAAKFLFATPAGTMVIAETDPQVGGDFLFVERRDGVDVLHTGEYLELERPRRMVFRFVVPHHSDEATTVMLEFIAKGAAVCDVMLTHTGVPAESADSACYAWKAILTAAGDTLNGV